MYSSYNAQSMYGGGDGGVWPLVAAAAAYNIDTMKPSNKH